MTSPLQYGGIYLANLNPQRKQAPSEVSKTRPVLIIQTQALLDADHPSTTILPLTTQLSDDNALRFRLPAQENLNHDSDLILDQIRSIDNQRFQSREALCVLDLSTMADIFHALTDLFKP